MITHHPEPDILTEYAGGALHQGAMLVIACHLEGCALCRQEVSLWESAGGALLEETEGVAMSEGALGRVLARLETRPRATQTPVLPGFLRGFDIPGPLARQKIGRRRVVMPGIWFAPLGEGEGSARTYLVYAKANTVLAEHNHQGREFTQVLGGAFRDDLGIFARGDFVLTDDSLEHSPTVTGDGACLCLISADAPMRLKSFPARLVQAVTGTLY